MKYPSKIFLFLAEYEIWVVGGITALTFLSSSLLPLALLAALFFWMFRWIGRRQFGVRTLADSGIILIILMAAVSLWVTPIPEKTLPQVYRLFTGIALFYAFANWRLDEKKLKLTISLFLAGGLGIALFSAISVQWTAFKLPFIPVDLYEDFKVLVEDTVNPNVMAGSLLLFLPFSISVLLFLPRQKYLGVALLGLISLLIMVGAIALTQSRAAFLVLIVIGIIFFVLKWRHGWLILIIIPFAGWLLKDNYWVSQFFDSLLLNQSLGSGFASRSEIWSRGVLLIQDFPFTGIGMGSFGDVVDVIYPFLQSEPGRIPHAHNLFLQIAVDLGLPGLVAWVSILIASITIAWQTFRHGKRTGSALAVAVGASVLASQAALVTHGLFDAVTWGQVRPAPFVWAIWGVAIAAQRLFILGPQSTQNGIKKT